MIPISDSRRTGSFPFITYSIITVNIIVFIFMYSMSQSGLSNFIQQYALIPAEVFKGNSLNTLLTSMFLHGGLGHIFGNMVFLNVFGDNLEDEFGHFKYLLFYLITGVFASFLQIFVNFNSTIPNLGASGAIAGLLGGYLVLFPRNKVDVIIPIGYYIRRAIVPAKLMLLYWIGFQFLQGIGTLGIDGGGVAYFAHIGGFISGVLITLVYKLLFYNR